MGGHSGWAHTVIHPFCDHYSWPVASLVGMAILHTGNEHFRFTQPHLHIVGFIICTRAGLAPSEVIYTAVLYQGEAFFQVRVILFYSDLVCACGRGSYSCRTTHTHTVR